MASGAVRWLSGQAGPGVGPGSPEPQPGRSRTSGSDDVVDADPAAGAAGLVDLLQRVLGRLDALPGLTLERLVVRVAGGQRAAAGLVHQVLDALSQGNHSSVGCVPGLAGKTHHGLRRHYITASRRPLSTP